MTVAPFCATARQSPCSPATSVGITCFHWLMSPRTLARACSLSLRAFIRTIQSASFTNNTHIQKPRLHDWYHGRSNTVTKSAAQLWKQVMKLTEATSHTWSQHASQHTQTINFILWTSEQNCFCSCIEAINHNSGVSVRCFNVSHMEYRCKSVSVWLKLTVWLWPRQPVTHEQSTKRQSVLRACKDSCNRWWHQPSPYALPAIY